MAPEKNLNQTTPKLYDKRYRSMITEFDPNSN